MTLSVSAALPARTARISLTEMLRVLIILAICFGALANAAHSEAHASGQHSHDAVEANHHADDHEDDRGADDNVPAKADHKADHAAGHSHVVGDRSAGFEVGARSYGRANAPYGARPDRTLASALSAPLLEPPSA